MANFDNIGEFGLGQILARRLTTPGGAVAPTVAPELFPVMTLENDRPEWAYLKGEILCGAYAFRAAVAGQYSCAQLYVPSTERTIAVVTRIQLRATAAVQISRLIGISGGLGGWVAANTTTRDFRANANGTSARLELTTNVAQPNRFTTLDVLDTTNQILETPIIITPGTSLGLYTQAVNTTQVVSLTWYERQAQPGELL